MPRINMFLLTISSKQSTLQTSFFIFIAQFGLRQLDSANHHIFFYQKEVLQEDIRKGKKNMPEYFECGDYGQIIKYLPMRSNFTRYQDSKLCYESSTRLLL